MNKDIILCADDYAQNPDICEGILLLAEKKRINAISCLVNSPIWLKTHQELGRIKPTTSIGLHFNVTFGKPLSTLWQKQYGQTFYGLTHIFRKCYLRQLENTVVEAEIRAQLDAFTTAMGFFPDFIDGHQHVHQLPIIRDAWLKIYIEHQLTSFFRNTSNGWIDFLSTTGFPKRQMMSLLGGITFKNRLMNASIPTNTSFSGIYNFIKGAAYSDYFKAFLSVTHHGGLIMCHPGVKSNDVDDPLHLYRCHELNYFMSDQLMTDLKAKFFQLTPSLPTRSAGPSHFN